MYGNAADAFTSLVLVQTKLLLATLLKGLNVKVALDQDQTEMEDVQAAVLTPNDRRCLLMFTERRGKLSKEVHFDEH